MLELHAASYSWFHFRFRAQIFTFDPIQAAPAELTQPCCSPREVLLVGLPGWRLMVPLVL